MLPSALSWLAPGGAAYDGLIGAGAAAPSGFAESNNRLVREKDARKDAVCRSPDSECNDQWQHQP